MSDRDGGPAFPVAADEYTKGFYGMSLRDCFAAAALQGLFSIEANPRVGVEMEPYCTKHNGMMAAQAYALADAMLQARVRDEVSEKIYSAVAILTAWIRDQRGPLFIQHLNTVLGEVSRLQADNERHKQWLREADQSWYAKLSAADEGVKRLTEALATAKENGQFYERRYNRIVDANKCRECGCHSISLCDGEPATWNCDGCKLRWPVDLRAELATAKRDAERYRAALCNLLSVTGDCVVEVDDPVAYDDARDEAVEALNPKGTQ